ncbi:MAG: alpha/beta fold hydrolase [Lysinibacillus sp.]
MKTGVLLLHGFSGGPYEVKPLATFLSEHTDWQIEVPTLSGHGEPEELNIEGYTAFDWLSDAEYSFNKLQREVDRVIVIGFSMGGVLALHLASKYYVEKVVLLSAAMKYVALPQLAKDIWSIAKEARTQGLENSELFKRYQFKIKNVPANATIQFMKVVGTVRKEMNDVKAPVYIVQGAQDGIVPQKTAFQLFEQLPSKEKWLYISESGKHHICFSDDSKRWFMHILKKLK